MPNDTNSPLPHPTLDRAPVSQNWLVNQWVRIRAQPARSQFNWVGVVILLIIVSMVGNRVLNPEVIEETETTTEVERRVAYESVDAPLNFLDITGAEYESLDPQAQVDYLIDHLSAVESRVLMKMNQNFVALVSFEAARLRDEARKEVINADPAAGQREMDLNDKSGKLQMEACLRQMQPYQCVLLRFAGDGIAMMQEGIQTNDIYLYANGVSRYHAALYALNDLQPQDRDPSSVLILTENYRLLLKQIVSRSPGSQIPPVAEQGSGLNGRSPIRSYLDQQGYETPQEYKSTDPATNLSQPTDNEAP